MRQLNLITVLLLVGVSVGVGACSAESSSRSEEEVATSSTQALSTAKKGNSHTPEGRRAHAAAAEASLGVLADLVASDKPEKRGFKSAAEAKSGKLTSAVPVFMVGLDKLSEYEEGQDPNSLLFDLEEAMYPLTVNGEVKSAVFVRKRASGNWEAAEFGRPNLAKAVHSHRESVSARRHVASQDLKMVDIPALGAKFLGHDEKGELMLSPIRDITGTELKAGQTRRAAEVFAMLKPIAQQVEPGSLN
jgi:hypothetical protein